MNRAAPGWALASSALAPIALVGGFTVAAAVQPSGYSSVSKTISALAAVTAAHRGIMTSALVVLGICHLVTACGVRVAHPPGRLVLGLGGVAVLGVAAFPLSATGHSHAHALFATVAFLALSVWPLRGVRHGSVGLLRVGPSVILTSVLLGLTLLFFLTLNTGVCGLTERLASVAQALTPLGVVLSARAHRRAEL